MRLLITAIAAAALTGYGLAGHHGAFMIHPGEAKTFTGVNRGDTVACRKGHALLRMTVTFTPSYVHFPGQVRRRLSYRIVSNSDSFLSVASPRSHVVVATCSNR